jgi:TatA/E family protein of Tat protein translocase
MRGRWAVKAQGEKAMIGPQDLWVALALGVFFFGAKKLPELSRSLGQSLSEFKKGVTGTEAVPLPKPEETPPGGRRGKDD